jgi:hypothetical protein
VSEREVVSVGKKMGWLCWWRVNEEPLPRNMTSQHLTPDKRQWAHKRITRDTRNQSARLTGPEASLRTVRQEPSASNTLLSHVTYPIIQIT